jgi:hypothetical protein
MELHPVSYLAEALCYKPESRGFDFRWGHWIFQFSFRSHYIPGVDSAANRNEYQKYSCGVKGRPASKFDKLTVIC